MRPAPLQLSALLAFGSALSLAIGCHQTSAPTTGAAPQNPPSPTAQGPAAPIPAPAPKGPLFIEPDAGYAWLYPFITGAHSSIDMTMYELADTTFSADLVAACQRGVKVRVILDQNLEKANNIAAYNQLSAAGPNCSVAWANPQFQATHQKTILVDGKTAAILTCNLTSRYYTTSRDFGLLDTNAADLKAIEATFTKDFQSSTDLSYKPPAGHDLIWSPTTAQKDLLGLISNAKLTLLVENEELGAASIVTALASACKRGVTVSLAMTDTSANYHANYVALEQAGCGVHVGANDADTLYIHAKAIVADLGTTNAIGYLGSINFSNASMTENRELGRYLHDTALLQQVATTITHDYNQFPAYSTSIATATATPALARP